MHSFRKISSPTSLCHLWQNRLSFKMAASPSLLQTCGNISCSILSGRQSTCTGVVTHMCYMCNMCTPVHLLLLICVGNTHITSDMCILPVWLPCYVYPPWALAAASYGVNWRCGNSIRILVTHITSDMCNLFQYSCNIAVMCIPLGFCSKLRSELALSQ